MSLKFQQLVTTANQVAAKFNGARDTCVLTSYALHNVLQRLGYNSHPLRIEAAVFPDDRKFHGSILGGWREPGPRRAASPDKWWGHLAVVVDDEWLLDPTLDQANKKEWPRSMHVGPQAPREAAMAAFVKSWRYESRQPRVNQAETISMAPSGTSYG